MAILVCGGAGYIGSHAVHALIEHKIRTRNITSSYQRTERKKARIVPKGQHNTHGATHLLVPSDAVQWIGP